MNEINRTYKRSQQRPLQLQRLTNGRVLSSSTCLELQCHTCHSYVGVAYTLDSWVWDM